MCTWTEPFEAHDYFLFHYIRHQVCFHVVSAFKLFNLRITRYYVSNPNHINKPQKCKQIIKWVNECMRLYTDPINAENTRQHHAIIYQFSVEANSPICLKLIVESYLLAGADRLDGEEADSQLSIDSPLYTQPQSQHATSIEQHWQSLTAHYNTRQTCSTSQSSHVSSVMKIANGRQVS